MIWLLDTNVVIHAARGKPASVRAHLRRISPEDLAISSVTVAELWYGAEKSPTPERKREAWAMFLDPFDVLPFDRRCAEQHAHIRYALRAEPIGERDLFIAAIALANNLILVTHNTSEFTRVPGLRVEDWGPDRGS